MYSYRKPLLSMRTLCRDLCIWMQLHCQHTIKRRYSQERTGNLRSHSAEIQKQFLSLLLFTSPSMWVWGIYLGTSISLFVSDSVALTEPDDEFKLRTPYFFSISYLITVILLWQCVVLLFLANCRAASVLLCLVSGKASDNKPLTLSTKLHIFTHNSPIIACATEMNDTTGYKLRCQTAGW